MTLGRNIARLRKLNNMTETELAAQAGIKQPYLSQLETGRHTPSLAILQQIAKVLKVTVSELLGEVQNPVPNEMRKLIQAAEKLNPGQVDALISLVREMGDTYMNDDKEP